ncbi:MAG: MBL fold metallo-hydrolase [Acidobacteria bacterium]|nr:MBL fold metallo-hydrolase [Acidobacteriota bacterium]
MIVFFSAGTGSAQQDGAEVEVLQVRPNFYMIAGAGGNIGVQIGPDGVLLVNTGTREASGEVLAAIQKLSKEPIRYIINTSADADVVGGNAALSKGRSVLGVMAHENVLKAMSAPSGQASPFPTDAWPNETFYENRRYLYLNDEGIEILHQPAAHTDGDAVVFFRRSDVVVAGHVLDDTRFPVIDLARGGSIQGEIDALNRLIALAIPPGPFLGAPQGGIAMSEMPGGTEVVPGRGRVYRQLDVVEYRDMVVIIRDTIEYMIDQKMTLDQIKAAAPAKAWDPRFGATSGSWTTNQFVEAIYESLMNENGKSRER